MTYDYKIDMSRGMSIFVFENQDCVMMPGSKGQKAVHACMIRLLNLGPAKHEEEVICVANQRIPNVCRIAGAACCGAIRGRQLGAKDLLTPTSCY